MARRAFWTAILTMAAALASVACGSPAPPPPVAAPSTPISGPADGFCSLVSRTALEGVYGPMLQIHNDHGPIAGDSVRGSCDYLVDKTNDYRVFFTININTDGNRETFESVLTAATSTKMPVTDAEVFSLEGGVVHLVAHKKSITMELELRVGSAVADGQRDNAVALQLLGEALSHY